MKPGYLSTLTAWRETRGRPDARKLVVLHMVDCVGNGVYFSTFALYLNRHAGLGAWTIGTGLSVGAACGLASNLVVGRIADSARAAQGSGICAPRARCRVLRPSAGLQPGLVAGLLRRFLGASFLLRGALCRAHRRRVPERRQGDGARADPFFRQHRNGCRSGHVRRAARRHGVALSRRVSLSERGQFRGHRPHRPDPAHRRRGRAPCPAATRGGAARGHPAGHADDGARDRHTRPALIAARGRCPAVDLDHPSGSRVADPSAYRAQHRSCRHASGIGGRVRGQVIRLGRPRVARRWPRRRRRLRDR